MFFYLQIEYKQDIMITIIVTVQYFHSYKVTKHLLVITALIKATIQKYLQRAGGRCEPVRNLSLSTFGAVGESRRMVPFIVLLSGRITANWVATRSPFVPCVCM